MVANRRKAIQKQATSISAEGKDDDAQFEDEDDFLELDDLKESNNIDLADDEFDQLSSEPKDGGASIQLIARTPLALIPLSDKEKDGVTLFAANGEPLGSRCDFRMNTSLMHSSGALLLDLGERFRVEELQTRSQQSQSQPQQQPTQQPSVDQLASALAAMPNKPIPESNDDQNDGVHDWHYDDDDDDDGPMADDDDGLHDPTDVFSTQNVLTEVAAANGDALKPASAASALPERMTTRKMVAAVAEAVRNGSSAALAAFVDPWAPLDPHLPNKALEKPFKKGKTFRIPACLKESKSGSDAFATVTAPLIPISAFCAGVANTHKPVPTNKLKGLTFSDLDYLYWPEQKRRESQRKQDKQRLMSRLLMTAKGRRLVRRDGWDAVESPFLASDSMQDAQADMAATDTLRQSNNLLKDGDDDIFGAGPGSDVGYDNNDNDDDDDNNNEDLVYWGDDGANDSNSDAPARVTMTDAEAALFRAGDVQGQQPVEITMSYEELVRNYVDKFLKSAVLYAQETALSKRVAEWDEKIRPFLREQDERPPFDMLATGSVLIQTFKEIPAAAKEPVPFSNVVSNHEVFEVCRMFVSCLQLANQGNVAISRDQLDPDTGMRVKFLHGNAVYNFTGESEDAPESQSQRTEVAAPNLAASPENATTSSRTSKATKSAKSSSKATEPMEKPTKAVALGKKRGATAIA
ncbi:hypothetical protein, variant 1 [Capsaspora owczarzaki ATCC 30864]|nr:hypothetical protein, variant 1 [Capsaspora owczarzaki ATCC 30864]